MNKTIAIAKLEEPGVYLPPIQQIAAVAAAVHSCDQLTDAACIGTVADHDFLRSIWIAPFDLRVAVTAILDAVDNMAAEAEELDRLVEVAAHNKHSRKLRDQSTRNAKMISARLERQLAALRDALATTKP